MNTFCSLLHWKPSIKFELINIFNLQYNAYSREEDAESLLCSSTLLRRCLILSDVFCLAGKVS